MMLLPTKKDWEEWGIYHPTHQFFVQRWHELFAEETYDSWQVQMSSLHTILDELTAIVSVIAHTPLSHHNFGVLVDEAKAVAALDPVIVKHFPFVRKLLEATVYDQGIKLNSGTVTITDIRDDTNNGEEERFFGQDSSASILSVNVQALDPHSARARAEEELCSLLSLNRLYQPHKGKGATWNCDHLALVEKSGCLERQAVPSDVSRLTYVRHASKPAEATADALRLVEALKNGSQRDILHSSLMYHRLFTEAPSDEARLVNLWIALEILIPTGQGSTIDRASDYVSTILTTEYPVSLAKALPISMRTFWRTADKEAFLQKLSRSNTHRFDVYDVLRCLTDRKDGDLITALLTLVGQQPMLTHKVYLLWKSMFCDPETMGKRLAGHKLKLDWQVRRIYRARNFVMHRGRSVPGMRQLIQHLHTYYIKIIHTIIHDLRFRPEWGIAEVCESRKSLYANALTKLKEHDTNPVTLGDVIMFFSPTNHLNDPVWPHLLERQKASC